MKSKILSIIYSLDNILLFVKYKILKTNILKNE